MISFPVIVLIWSQITLIKSLAKWGRVLTAVAGTIRQVPIVFDHPHDKINRTMKSTPLFIVAAAMLSLAACKKAPETSGSAPAPEAPKVEAPKAVDFEAVLLDSFKESGNLLKKFAEGGSKEDFISGMKALAEKNKSLEESSPEIKEKAAAFAQTEKFKQAVQELQKEMMEVVTKHPDFAQKIADPEVQEAMQSLGQ
ncbi:MAG: hypothetical protein QM680_03970 [Luteolibacter sp.]